MDAITLIQSLDKLGKFAVPTEHRRRLLGGWAKASKSRMPRVLPSFSGCLEIKIVT